MKKLTTYIYQNHPQRIRAMQGALWNRSTSSGDVVTGLDIGCGSRKRDGFLGMDLVATPSVDVINNLEQARFPFADNTFDIVYANHVLEHVRNLESVLGEMARVLKEGGKAQIGVPYAGSLRAFQDPTHVRFFTLKTFEYYVEMGSTVGAWYVPCLFKCISRRSLVFSGGVISTLVSSVVNRRQSRLIRYELSTWRYLFPAQDLHVELIK